MRHIDFVPLIAKELSVDTSNVRKTVQLLNEGATVPFIARYRKEATGSLDEVVIAEIKRLLQRFEELEKRRDVVLSSIQEQGKLTTSIAEAIAKCTTLSELEDLYLPFKQKRKTKATIARENGLEPLAKWILKQEAGNCEAKARSFLNKVVATTEDALEGARNIIAEEINENAEIRNVVRSIFNRKAFIFSKVVKSKIEDAAKLSDYFNSKEALNKIPSHRFLAIMRGANEGLLRVHIAPEEDADALFSIERRYIKTNVDAVTQIKLAIEDSYKRLIAPSIETEFLNASKEKADREAIKVFSENLFQLLLASPLGQKRVLAIDPGFKSGCKLVCLDEQGNLQHNETIYPHPPQSQTKQAGAKILQLCEIYKIESIAIGNGTAGRETEHFIQQLKFHTDVQVFSVSEQGASIYSASPIAREEFPEYDVTVRGAVSIGRRLMDPLAELVKIDPKSIGVGQYQHDVDQQELKLGLDEIVERAVNKVGINLNTASKHLLQYVSGVGPTLAQNIVSYRKENGAFETRQQLKKVPRLGDKAFEQCAGFLRIREAKHPLDNTAVHPERYELVERIAKDLKCTLVDLIKDAELRKQIDLTKYVDSTIGLPTLNDIMQELAKPGLDPRSKIKVFEFAKGITKPEHLQIGMKLPGIVTNITRFGAFVDVGVKQDGLIHLSNLANKFVSDPAEVVKLHQQLIVKVIEIDLPRKRIGLSLKEG